MREWKNITKKRRSLLVDILDTHEKYSKSYFWSPRGNASQRRREEFETELSFLWKGQKVEISQDLSISCKNFYYTLNIFVDDCKKDIRIIKEILK